VTLASAMGNKVSKTETKIITVSPAP
jgi:hypothetical protein